MTIRTITVYNLVDANGIQLQLRLGYVQGERFSHENEGFRWSFEGTKIPMPIRSRAWFCGFPEKTMLDWLANQGWFVRTKVDMATGKTVVYDLPEPEEKEELYFVTNDNIATAYTFSNLESAAKLCEDLNERYGDLLYYILKGTEV